MEELTELSCSQKVRHLQSSIHSQQQTPLSQQDPNIDPSLNQLISLADSQAALKRV
jgi:hypothetical protein